MNIAVNVAGGISLCLGVVFSHFVKVYLALNCYVNSFYIPIGVVVRGGDYISTSSVLLKGFFYVVLV